jgi:cold shock CspA family protein
LFEECPMLGTVIKYDRISGYGFIVSDDPTLPDFFVCPRFIDADRHHRFLVPSQRVEFDPVDVATKPKALNVRVIPTTIARQTSGEAVRQ